MIHLNSFNWIFFNFLLAVVVGDAHNGTDLCGGCAPGLICHDTGITCFTTPCASWKCIEPLKEDFICRSKTIDQKNDCKEGTICLHVEGQDDIFTCQVDPCLNFQWPDNSIVFCTEDSECPKGEVCGGCQPSGCSCEDGYIRCTNDCQTTCGLSKLELGAVCKSGGIERPGIDRRDDCASPFICLPNPNEVAIGGEVTWYCTETCSEDVTYCDKASNSPCAEDEICDGCEEVCTCKDGTKTCSLPCRPICKLKAGSVCKSGGVETGLGIDRVNNCVKPTECKPEPDVVAPGGEVPWICQSPCADYSWPPSGITFCQKGRTEPCSDGKICGGCVPSKCECTSSGNIKCGTDCQSICQIGKDDVCIPGDEFPGCIDGFSCKKSKLTSTGSQQYTCQDSCGDFEYPNPNTKFCNKNDNKCGLNEECTGCVPSQCDCQDGVITCTEDCLFFCKPRTKCCDDNPPQCSSDNPFCHREGIYCCSDGMWHPSSGGGHENTCLHQELQISERCEINCAADQECEEVKCKEYEEKVEGQCCPECKPKIDCSLVRCMSVPDLCSNGLAPIKPEGECCLICPKDCSASVCLKPDCSEKEKLVSMEGECCPQCISVERCRRLEVLSSAVYDCSDLICKEDGEEKSWHCKSSCCRDPPPPCPASNPHCYWEGIFCCSDGSWYPSIGAGAEGTCQQYKLGVSKQCESTDDCSTVAFCPACTANFVEIRGLTSDRCCPECQPTNPDLNCSTVRCAAPNCEEPSVPYKPSDSCCEICRDAECSNTICLSPVCEDDQSLFIPPGKCCPMCKMDCSLVRCAFPICKEGYEVDYNPVINNVIDCCPTCVQKANYNCYTKEVWSDLKREWCCKNKNLGCQVLSCGGFAAVQCPRNYECVYPEGSTLGTCHQHCGGFSGVQCPSNFECNYFEGADYGTCAKKDQVLSCGGFSGAQCPPNYECIYPQRSTLGTCHQHCGGFAGVQCPLNFKCKYFEGADYGTCTEKDKSDCHEISDCETCLTSGCVMSTGVCQEMCVADASCYRLEHLKSAADVCKIRADNLAKDKLCRQQTDCQMCVEKDCLWNAEEEFIGCQSTCMPPMPCNPIYDSSQCPVPKDCEAYMDCETCLASGCKMSAGQCGKMCAMDVACYDLSYDSNKYFQEPNTICEIRADHLAKAELCGQQTNCLMCVEKGCLWNVQKGFSTCFSTCPMMLPCNPFTNSSQCPPPTASPTFDLGVSHYNMPGLMTLIVSAILLLM